jgi:hypothetical protein
VGLDGERAPTRQCSPSTWSLPLATGPRTRSRCATSP